VPSYVNASLGSGVRRAICIALVAVAVTIWAGDNRVRAERVPGVDEIVRQVEQMARIPNHVRMNQSVVARALLFTWRFNSVLEYVGDELTATTQGAPSFVPKTFPVELVSLGQTMPLFDLKVISESDENGFIVLGGPRSDYDGTGAEEATFTVDPADWLVKRATAKYAWGTLTLEQEFDSVEGYMLLRRQKATVRPLGLVVDVEYSNYSFESV